jgi:hypothetical protein
MAKKNKFVGFWLTEEDLTNAKKNGFEQNYDSLSSYMRHLIRKGGLL